MIFLPYSFGSSSAHSISFSLELRAFVSLSSKVRAANLEEILGEDSLELPLVQAVSEAIAAAVVLRVVHVDLMFFCSFFSQALMSPLLWKAPQTSQYALRVKAPETTHKR